MKKSIAILLVALMTLTVVSSAGVVAAAPPVREREVLRIPVYIDVGRESRQFSSEFHARVATLIIRERENRLTWRVEQVQRIDRFSGDAILLKERRIDFRFGPDVVVFLKGSPILLRVRDGFIIRGSGSLGRGDLDSLQRALRGQLVELHRLNRIGDERSIMY